MKKICSEDAILRKQEEQKIKSFSAIFPHNPIDESEYISAVCDATGAENSTIEPIATEFWYDLPTLVTCQEEPFISSSVYAQWRVMKHAKANGVTVMLDGQGGDELLGGYVLYYLYYFMTLMKQKRFHRFLLEWLLSRDLTKDLARSFIMTYVPRIIAYTKSLIMKIIKRNVTSSASSRWSYDKAWLSAASLSDLAGKLEIDTTVESLPALLRYEDKNSMWHGIEARVPFLHRPFFEYVASLPLERKIRNGWTKYDFRLAMKGIVPEKIRIRRSKVGFEVPQKRWFENELRQQLKDFFSNPNLKATAYFSAQAARNILGKHTLAKLETTLIWRMLNLELWYQEFFSEGNLARNQL